MTQTEPPAKDGPQDKPSSEEEQKSREAYEEWERGQREPGEHRLPRSDR